MKRIWLSGLCVWAGWFVGAAAGQEAHWRPASPRPLAIARTEGAPLSPPAGVSIGRPQPLAAPAEAGEGPDRTGVVPTAFRPAQTFGPNVIFRGQIVEDPPAAAAELTSKKNQADFAAPLPAGPGLAVGEILQKTPTPGGAAGKTSDPEVGPTPRTFVPGPDTSFAAESLDTLPPPDGVVLEGDGSLLGSTGSSWAAALKPRGQFYGSAEYLLWWVKGFNTPALATTSSPNVAQDQQGVLGPNSTVLFGGNRLTQDPFSGARFTAGYRFGPCNIWAIEGSYFFLGQQTTRFDATSPSPQVIARPFTALNGFPNGPAAELVASPGPGLFMLRGALRIDAPTQLWGAETNLRRTVCCGCNYKVDVLLGYRYLNLSDGLHITEDITNLNAVPLRNGQMLDPFSRTVVTDSFNTRNQFNGGQVGVAGEWQRGRWFVGGSLKVALGDMNQAIDIQGHTTITPPAGSAQTRQDFVGGLLALRSNSGTVSRDRLAIVPELSLKVGYQFSDNVRAFVGYDFLYVSSVVRPGDQIDPVLDVNQLPPNQGTGVRPAVPFRTTDFWAQGLTAGLEFRWGFPATTLTEDQPAPTFEE